MRRALPACLLGAALLASSYWALGGVHHYARAHRWGLAPELPRPSTVAPEILPVAMETPALDVAAENGSIPFGLESRSKPRPAAEEAPAAFPKPRAPTLPERAARPTLRTAGHRMRLLLHRSLTNSTFVPVSPSPGPAASSGAGYEPGAAEEAVTGGPTQSAPEPRPAAAPAPPPARTFLSVTGGSGASQGGGPARVPQAPSYGGQDPDDGAADQ